MRKAIILGTLIFGAIVFQAYAQCKKVHYFCTAQFSKEEQADYYTLNNQSKSIVFNKADNDDEKENKYEMSFIAYSGFNYRVSVCTDIVEGASDKVTFQLKQDNIIRVKDASGNTNIKRAKEVIFDSAESEDGPLVKFRVEKTRKMYLSVDIPSDGQSENKKLRQSDNVCVGVLIEHRKSSKTGF